MKGFKSLRGRIKNFFINLFDVLKRREMTFLPGHLAFFFIMSLVPILTVVGYLLSNFNMSLDFITDFINSTFGSEVSSMIVPNLGSSTLSFKFIITILVGFYAASNGAAAVIITSNTIYGIEDKGFIYRRIKAAIITVFIIALFAFILIFPLFGNNILSFLHYLNLNDDFMNKVEFLFNLLRGPFAWFVIYTLIKIIYAMAPDKNLKSANVNYGALFTSVLWIIVTWIYSFYINHYAHYSVMYGGLANLVVLLLWFYFLAYIFTIGLALNYRKESLE